MKRIVYENTRPEFGDIGPYEFDNKEDAADSIMVKFTIWAKEAYDIESSDPINQYSVMYPNQKDEWIAAEIATMREEFISGLVPRYIGDDRVVFDVHGGVTIQLESGACHRYLDPEEAACDLIDYVLGDLEIDPDKDEIDAVFDPTQEQIDNGQYVVMSLREFQKLRASSMDSVKLFISAFFMVCENLGNEN